MNEQTISCKCGKLIHIAQDEHSSIRTFNCHFCGQAYIRRSDNTWMMGVTSTRPADESVSPWEDKSPDDILKDINDLADEVRGPFLPPSMYETPLSRSFQWEPIGDSRPKEHQVQNIPRYPRPPETIFKEIKLRFGHLSEEKLDKLLDEALEYERPVS